MGIKTVPQPPYSPDLAPCDFCLFPKLRVCRYDFIRSHFEVNESVPDVYINKSYKRNMIDWLISWLIYNGMSKHLWLFYAQRWGNCVRYKSLSTFFLLLFLVGFSPTVTYQLFISSLNYLHTVIRFQVLLSNTNNYMVSSNYFYLIISIAFHTVVYLQVFLSYTYKYIISSIFLSTGWNLKIVALEKTTWFHFLLMKTGFLFLLQTIY